MTPGQKHASAQMALGPEAKIAAAVPALGRCGSPGGQILGRAEACRRCHWQQGLGNQGCRRRTMRCEWWSSSCQRPFPHGQGCRPSHRGVDAAAGLPKAMFAAPGGTSPLGRMCSRGRPLSRANHAHQVQGAGPHRGRSGRRIGQCTRLVHDSLPGTGHVLRLISPGVSEATEPDRSQRVTVHPSLQPSHYSLAEWPPRAPSTAARKVCNGHGLRPSQPATRVVMSSVLSLPSA